MRTGFAENPGHKGEYCNTGLCVTISHRDTQRKILIIKVTENTRLIN
jgi:hypothetical protein